MTRHALSAMLLELLLVWAALLVALVAFAIGRPGRRRSADARLLPRPVADPCAGGAAVSRLGVRSRRQRGDPNRLRNDHPRHGRLCRRRRPGAPDRSATRCRKGRAAAPAGAGVRTPGLARARARRCRLFRVAPPVLQRAVADFRCRAIGDIADPRLMARSLWRRRGSRSAPHAGDARPVAAAAAGDLGHGRLPRLRHLLGFERRCFPLRDHPAAHLVLSWARRWRCSWAFHYSLPIWASARGFGSWCGRNRRVCSTGSTAFRRSSRSSSCSIWLRPHKLPRSTAGSIKTALVGAAVMYHEDGSAPFAYGATVPLWALIPRAVWPDKPAVGGRRRHRQRVHRHPLR